MAEEADRYSWDYRISLAFVAGLSVMVALTPGPVKAETTMPYEITGDSIAGPLTDMPGDPKRGLSLVRDPANASCLICHSLPIPNEPDQGALGPSLEGVAGRLSEAELRLRLVNPKQLNPDTIMPGYYVVEGLYRVDLPYQGKPIYDAQQVEDVLAYLMTLVDE